MKRFRLTAAALLLLGSLAPLPARSAVLFIQSGDAYARIDDETAVIGNSLIRREWDLFYFPGYSRLEGRNGTPAFNSLERDPLDGRFNPPFESASAFVLPSGGIELRLHFLAYTATGLPEYRILRTARVQPSIGAIRMQTTITPFVPIVTTGYLLESLSVADETPQRARAIGFNGGADWHSDTGYDYRRDTVAASFDANAEWLDLSFPSGVAFGALLERRNYLSSRMRWKDETATVAVDLSKDLLYLGPIEPYVVPNPTPAPIRTRRLAAGQRFVLEPVILAVGASEDEMLWYAHRALRADMRVYPNTVNFNTDRVHTPGIDVGARDGVNQAVFNVLRPIAKDLGVETFVLDDGWQKYNGDWAPDPDRYPNGLEPVRDALEADGMRLGLWMAPGNFHPSSGTFRDRPSMACIPTGLATAAYNAADPDSGSNAAGIGIWDFNGPAGTEIRYRDVLWPTIYILARDLNISEFKFDFLVWTDCAFGDLYEQHDAFFNVIDSLGRSFGETGFGLDETNDFRGFPFESILRGATWFQNGNPNPGELLHNLWTLQPYVPGFAIGQAVTIRNNHTPAEIDERMAVALGSHITFWTDIRELAGRTAILDRVKLWTDFFKQHRSLNGFSYPLLADPLGRDKWSGLQPWDPTTNSGYAMLYRFKAPNVTQTVQFRGVHDADTYVLTDITPTGPAAVVGTFTGAELRSGIPLTIATPGGVRILRIEPAP